ncbi:hypothetical protein Ancab_007615 [Ancistrocladus abbreviatus]
MFSVSPPPTNFGVPFPPRGATLLLAPSSISKLNPRKFSKIRCSSTLRDKEKRPSSSHSSAVEREEGGRLKVVTPSLDVASLPFPPIKVAKRVVLVRHGQSTWNEEGRIQGSSDYAVLTQKGEAQAETSRQMLIDESFDVCFASPLNRARRTAEIIWGNRREEMIMEYDLREIDLYSFQGLLKHEGKEKFGDAYRQWQVDAANFNIDGHYPVRELWARARSCWNRMLAHESRSVLVVAHNAVNQALIATAMGLGAEYFRMLLQSNCGVSVLDFIPRTEDGCPHMSLNRLNQTPNSPIVAGSSGGRITNLRIILVCHGSLQIDTEASLPLVRDLPMSMLGIIQSQKIAELLLDLKINTIVTSPEKASMQTAVTISEVQEAADCLGADCIPRYVDMKKIEELDLENIFRHSNRFSGLSPFQVDNGNQIAQDRGLEGLEDGLLGGLWNQSEKAWQNLLDELSDGSEPQKTVVVVGCPTVHTSLIAHCLNLTQDWMGSFHLDEGSISVIDFPDGPTGRGIIRCINYTAHLGRWSVPITKPTMDNEEF